MLTAIHDAIRRWHLQDGVRKAIVAVSGGADSVALLHALRRLWQPEGIELVVAHVDHGIRGDASRDDAGFVRELAARWGLPVRVAVVDVPAAALARGESIEMAARRLRRGALAEITESERADAVCTGHTLDDQVETVFLRLGRGTGPHGIGGILPRARLEGSGLPVLRPLLACRRADLRHWLEGEGIAWRDDATNADLRVPRNRVREQLLPVFRDVFGDNGFAAVARLAELVQEEEARWLVPATRAALLAACPSNAGGRGVIDCRALRGLPEPLLRRVLLAWLQDCGLAASDQTAGLVRRLAEFASASSRGTRELPLGSGHSAVRTYEALHFRVRDAAVAEPRPCIQLAVPGVTMSPEWGLQVEVQPGRGQASAGRRRPLQLPQTVDLLASAVAGCKLTLRSAAPGDRVSPAGGPGRRKVAEMLVDAKVPRNLRPQVPVLCCDGDVAWVPGIAVASHLDVRAGPHHDVLRITLRSTAPCRSDDTPTG